MIYLGNGMYSDSGPDNQLMHYGILGMRWGVRKAKLKQNISRYYDKKAAKHKIRTDYKRDKKNIKGDKKNKRYITEEYKGNMKELRTRHKNSIDHYYDNFITPIFYKANAQYRDDPKSFKKAYPTIKDVENIGQFVPRSVYDTYKVNKKSYKNYKKEYLN